jgi:hypothetical protein
MSRLVGLTALVSAAALALPAGAAGVSIDGVEVGFGGAYRAGEWTPIAVRGKGVPSSVVVETLTADADGTVVRRVSRAERGGAGLRAVFQAGRLGSDLTVRLRGSDGVLLAEQRQRYRSPALPEAVPPGTPLWVAAGGLAAEGKAAVAFPDGVAGAALAGELPGDRLAYAAADVLFVRGDLAPSTEQAEALRAWVAGGGHLAIALGRSTDEFRAGPLAKWVPIEVGETVQLLNLAGLEEYSRSKQSLPRRARVRAARLGKAAEVLSPGAALIARSPYGFGRVTVFAFDLDALPFSTWSGLPDVLRRALLEEEEASRGSHVTAAGVTDLSTQLLRATEVVQGLGRQTTGDALLALLVYAAVVGPLDYFVVHRLLRRPALTWVTLPLIVAGAAWWLDRSAVAANGTASRFRQFDLVDVDAASGTLRGRTDVALYSAESTRADLAISPKPVAGASERAPAARLGWAAPAEATFGGTLREAAGGFFRSEYEVPIPVEEAAAARVPLLVWSGRHFEAEWQRGDAAGVVESHLVGRGRGRLEGQMVHRLPGPVKEYFVVYGDRVYLPREPEWHPGEAIRPASGVFLSQDLISFLTRRQTRRVDRKSGSGGDEFVVSETAYDPASTDLNAVVRTLTFYRAAGGRAYTGLTNLTLAADDLTPLLRMGRAVVVGELDASVAEATVTGGSGAAFEAGRRTTYVRLVLPVEASEAAPADIAPPNGPTPAGT